jgi:hypothetical protein
MLMGMQSLTHNFGRRAALVFLASWTAPALADPGMQLAQQHQDRPAGKDMTTLSRMELIDNGRTPRVRRLVSYRLDKGRNESAYLVRFIDPKDIAGVGLLSLNRADGSSDQSLYLPELDRVRRVAGDRKGGRFVGSDLYFEDLQERKAHRDRHRILGQEVIAGVACDVLESVPTDPGDSVYRRRVSWIDRETLMAVRVDYFERDDQKPSKRWTATARQRIQGFWTVTNSTMADLAQGSETRLIVESARYDRKLPAKLFTPQALADEGFESEYRT